MLPSAGGLRLDRDGFVITNLFRRSAIRWQDASGFAAIGVPPSSNKMVLFDHAAAKGGMMGRLNTGLVGRNAGLPDTYGLSAEALAGLMERWRERALATRS